MGLLWPDPKISVYSILSRCKDSAGDGVLNPVKQLSSDLCGNVVAELMISSNVMSVRSVFFRRLYSLILSKSSPLKSCSQLSE